MAIYLMKAQFKNTQSRKRLTSVLTTEEFWYMMSGIGMFTCYILKDAHPIFNNGIVFTTFLCFLPPLLHETKNIVRNYQIDEIRGLLTLKCLLGG